MSRAEDSAVNQANRRFGQMEGISENGWEQSWIDLRDYISPTRGNFDGDKSEEGEMVDHQKVLDGYATIAVNILASGLLSGMTSPNRPWFKMELEDDFLNDLPQVREWLDDTEGRMQAALNGSNIYQILHGTYTELGTFGTGCFIVLEDFQDVVRGQSFTSGEYYIGTDYRGRVESFAREYWMTVEQMVEEFGKENVGASVMADWRNNQRLKEYKIRHLIEPNDFKVDGFPSHDRNGPLPYT